jgi:hypothetical protein
MLRATNWLRGRRTIVVMRTGLYQKQAVQRLQSILGRLLKRQQRLACPYSLFIIIAYSLKEKERTDKKAAKVEKERKDKESQEKARSMMASFFGKPKPSTTSASSSKVPVPSASTTLSEFDRIFKPFTLKKDVELAPTNWFQNAKRRKRFADADVIVIDDDGTDSGDCDIEMIEREPSSDANTRGNVFFIWLLTIL